MGRKTVAAVVAACAAVGVLVALAATREDAPASVPRALAEGGGSAPEPVATQATGPAAAQDAEPAAAQAPAAQAAAEAPAAAAEPTALRGGGRNVSQEAAAPVAESHSDCLCVFDIDRTLTGKQGVQAPTCPDNRVLRRVWDDAYGGGELTLSPLARHGVLRTACGACKIGIVSHGTAGGRTMKRIMRGLIRSGSDHWSSPGNVHSPMVLGCADKPPCVRDVMDWYNRHGARISPSDVYLFDDKGANIEAFRGGPFNAHRISCRALDGGIGLCGAEPHEIRLERGVTSC